MDTTVSTSAFDAIITLEESLAMWTARGFASGSRCGFDLTIATTAADALPEFLRAVSWWDLDVDTFPMTLTADDIRLELSLAASSSHGEHTTGELTSRLALVFPTPRNCATLTFTIGKGFGGAQAPFDAAALARDLDRWRRRHQPPRRG